MELNQFNFNAPLQLRWNDLDALGHVNNAVFITYFEVARGYFMLKACPKWNWHKDMFLIANANIDYRKELLLTAEAPRVYVRTSKIGSKSFVLEYAVVSGKDGERVVHATGTTTQIMFDMKAKTTIEVPDWAREALSQFDNL